MPLYNYKCPKGHEFEAINSIKNRALSQCGECGRMAKQTISRRPAAVHRFKFGVFEDMTLEPVYAKSKKHMRELCNRYECYAPGVLD